MRPSDQARWNPVVGDVVRNGKVQRTVVDRGRYTVRYRCSITSRLATCTLRTWTDWVEEVIHAEQ